MKNDSVNTVVKWSLQSRTERGHKAAGSRILLFIILKSKSNKWKGVTLI